MKETKNPWQKIKTLLKSEEVEQKINEIVQKIKEDFSTSTPLAVFGMARKGIPLAEKIQKKLEQAGFICESGQMDATFYRDDFHYRNPLKNPEMQVQSYLHSLDGKNVLLVDDVLYTGRSIKAALNAISDLGRPAIVRLAILVDRGGREMPIAADYVGLKVTSTKSQEVQVFFEPEQRVDLIEVLNVPD